MITRSRLIECIVIITLLQMINKYFSEDVNAACFVYEHFINQQLCWNLLFVIKDRFMMFI